MLAGAALHAEARAASSLVADVGFLSPGHRIVVKVTLSGKGPFAMLLDTGTDRSIIDATLAHRLRALSDATPGPGAGTMPPRGWDMRDLRLGHLRADSVAAEALDLGRISARLGMHVDGVLGYSCLVDRIVQIDYGRHRLRFFRGSPSWSGSESVEEEMTVDPSDPTPRFAARVNRREVLLLFDSASSHPLTLLGAAIPFLGLKAAFEAARPDSAAGDGGRDPRRVGRVPVVEIGPIRLTDAPCVFGAESYGESWDRKTAAGTIGGALLDGLIVTLDYSRGSIRFER